MAELVNAKKPRIDGQLTALAGELFVAAELLKRGLQTSVTFGNAKAIDLFAHNPRSGKSFTVQVKSLRRTNYYPISAAKVRPDHVYVFVLLNEPGTPVEYFVVPGQELVLNGEQFGKSFADPTFPCVHPKSLRGFQDNWGVFEIDGQTGQDAPAIRAAKQPREGWDAAFREMARRGDDALVDDAPPSLSGWDEDEWQW